MRPEERERKVVVLAIVAFLAAALLIGRLVFLTVVKGPSLAQMGQSYRVRVMPIPAPRGKIYDRNGHLLVTNRPAFAAYYFSLSGPPAPDEGALLKRDLGLTPTAYARAIATFDGAPYVPVMLKTDLSNIQLTHLMQDMPHLHGVFVNAIPLREDLLGSVGGQVIGYVGPITQAELKASKDPRVTASSVVGQTGLEAQYQQDLQGTDGGEEIEVNAVGQAEAVLGQTAPIPGDSLVLTIDKNLEEVTAKALAADMNALHTTYGAQAPADAGSAVVMDVHTGQILAIVSLPSYDPNAFARGISQTAYAQLSQNPAHPFIDRVIQSAVPPGSTYKMSVAMAGLLAGTITPQTTVPGNPVYWYPPYPKNWVHVNVGPTDLAKAIAQSDDIYFYEVGRRTGIDAIARMSQAFGFGQKTGIDLPGEVAGLIPTKAYYVKQNGAYYPGLNYSIAIGQGADEVTLAQLVRYVGAIATNGDLYRPYLVEKVLSPSGRTLSVTSPDLVRHIQAPAAYWQAIQQGMQGVTHPGSIPGPGGTAGADFVNFPMQVAGKTGTAQVPGAGSMTFFVSYAPYNNPQIAVAVSIEGGVEGALDASVARAIYDAYFHIQDPNPPFVSPGSAPTVTTGH